MTKTELNEKEIETQILTFLNYQPDVFAFKVNTVGVFDPVRNIYRKNWNRFIHKGTSDIIGVCRGRFFALECKTPKTYKKALADIESDQSKFIYGVIRKGGGAAFVCSVEQAEQFLNGVRRAARS
jgi:penicillin-binding protein-related factor A (putative recombinase)